MTADFQIWDLLVLNILGKDLKWLSHIINGVVNNGKWRPIRVSRGGPTISHLMFANDLLLFGEEKLRGSLRVCIKVAPWILLILRILIIGEASAMALCAK
ncbi:uncharacterized protein LOC114759144 isoform X3 [Neltuma alba]|nr:uncharacterized protein LOC114759144 isoform X3 [Prosopis alba]